MKRSALGNRRQAGFTFWSVVFYVLVLGAAMVLALRIAPSYLEYRTVRDIMERAVNEWNPSEQGTFVVKTRIRKLLQTSQIYVIKAEDVKVYRDKNDVVVDANYETRFPLFWIVDGVMVFDDLVFRKPVD